MKAEREDWFGAQDELDPDRLVFLDETATATNMARRYGRAPRGQRCRVAVPHEHDKMTTVTACLRTSGIVAPWLLDGAMNGQRFRTYVEQVLVPKLRPGDTLILDNLPAHKVAGIRQRLAKAGVGLLYLPPYSPNFNPIEQAFAKLKGRLRTAAARTVDDLHAAIRETLKHFTATECRNYIEAAGYETNLAVSE